MEDKMTLRNIRPGDIRRGIGVAEIKSVEKQEHQRSIQDYLRKNHERNELKRDVAQMKRDVDAVHMWTRVGVAMLVLVFAMQMLLWIAG